MTASRVLTLRILLPAEVLDSVIMKAIFLRNQQWGLHKATGPASLFCNLADALRAAALSSLAPHNIRFVPKKNGHTRPIGIYRRQLVPLRRTRSLPSPRCVEDRVGSTVIVQREENNIVLSYPLPRRATRRHLCQEWSKDRQSEGPVSL